MKQYETQPILKNSFYFLMLLFFFSCTRNTNSDVLLYTGFPDSKELKATTLEVDTAVFRYPFRIHVSGDKAVVLDYHSLDHYYHMLSYPDGHYLMGFGKKGEAPDESLSGDAVRWDKGTYLTLDVNKKELVRWNLDAGADSILSREVMPFDSKILSVLDFVVFDDSTFIVPDYSGDSRFCWVNNRGELLRKTDTIPTTNKEALEGARPALAQAWRSFIDYNPRNGILVAATQLGEVLEIFDLKKNTHLICKGPHGEPEFKLAGIYAIPSGIMGFSDVQVTNNAIYAVFNGQSFEEMAQQKNHPEGGKFIYVFGLDGKTLRKFVLDRYINGISVDEEAKRITATDVNSDQPIVEFHYD